MLIEEGAELLTEDQCWSLLGGAEVGRVGISVDQVPTIVPVNFRVVERHIVFRTSPGRKLTAARQRAVVAFEVDDFGPHDRSGWSVLVVGSAEVVDEPTVDQIRVAPYADGPRDAVVRIVPSFVSGRRLVHGPSVLAKA